MPPEQLTNEIRDMNLSFLMLAQTMIRTDRAQALFRLGITQEVADLLVQMSPQQLLRVASRNMTLCTVRNGDELVWSLLTDKHAPVAGEDATASRLHASVLMASPFASASMAA